MHQEGYKDKLKSLGFVAKPVTHKRTVVQHEDNGRVVGRHDEHGKPGTGVSSRVDATVTGGEARLNPAFVKAAMKGQSEDA